MQSCVIAETRRNKFANWERPQGMMQSLMISSVGEKEREAARYLLSRQSLLSRLGRLKMTRVARQRRQQVGWGGVASS